MPARTVTSIDRVVDFIRQNRLCTQMDVADGLNISNTTASCFIRQARREGLIRIAGKGDRQQFRYVAMIDWAPRGPSPEQRWMQNYARKVAELKR